MIRTNDRCGRLRIDEEALLKHVRTVLVELLEGATDQLLSIMRDEIQRTTHGGAPGKPEWRDALAADLREVYRVVADEVIEFGVGLPYMSYADAGYKFVRAMLVAYGSGNQAPGGEAIHTRPGELVWDEDLHDHHPSRALTEYNLPDAFNQVGNDFLMNAMKLMRTHFQSVLSKASALLPAQLFSGHTRIEPR